MNPNAGKPLPTAAYPTTEREREEARLVDRLKTWLSITVLVAGLFGSVAASWYDNREKVTLLKARVTVLEEDRQIKGDQLRALEKRTSEISVLNERVDNVLRGIEEVKRAIEQMNRRRGR